MTTGVAGGGDSRNDPRRWTKTLARPPSAARRTASWATRWPALMARQLGSAPIGMRRFGGGTAVSLTRPSIVPAPCCAGTGAAAKKTRARASAARSNLEAELQSNVEHVRLVGGRQVPTHENGDARYVERRVAEPAVT